MARHRFIGAKLRMIDAHVLQIPARRFGAAPDHFAALENFAGNWAMIPLLRMSATISMWSIAAS